MTGEVRWFVGVDWASENHHACLLELNGRSVSERSFPHSGDGLGELYSWILTKTGARPEMVAVAIEVPHGPVEALLERGFQVYAINPKQLDRFRDRFSIAGAKDDRRDAHVMADSLRTDQQNGVFHQILGLYLLQSLYHLDKISITWRCCIWTAGQCRDGTLSVIAYLANSLRFLLRLGVGEVREIAAHQATRRIAVADASFMIEIGDLLQPAEAYCGGKWRHDETASEPPSKLDRRFRERSDIRRDWLLHWLRGYPYVLEGVVHATMRYACLCCPQHAHKSQTLLKYALIVFERNTERRILAPIVASEIRRARCSRDQASPIVQPRESDDARAGPARAGCSACAMRVNRRAKRTPFSG
jgi:Transposase